MVDDMVKKKAVREEAEPVSGRAGPRSAVSLSGLREQAALLRHAQEVAHLAHVITRPDGSFETWSDTLPHLIGIPPDQIVRSTRLWLDLIHPADRELFRSTAINARKNAERARVEYRLWRKGSGWVHVRQVMEPIPGPADSAGRRRWFNTLQDISAEKIAAERIWRLNRLYAMLSGINSLVVRVRNRQQLFGDACEVAVRQGGFRAAWIGVRRNGGLQPLAWAGELGPLFAAPPASIVETDPTFDHARRVTEEGRAVVVLPKRDSVADGTTKTVLEALDVAAIGIVPLLNNGQTVGAMALYANDVAFFDDEELRLLQDLGKDLAFALEYLDKSEKAEYLAYYDPITGLANRTLFLERVMEKLGAAQSVQGRVALLIYDIQNFKMLNDSFGRSSGDTLLKDIAARLSAAAPGRTIGRVAGDQFAIVVPGVISAEDLTRRMKARAGAIFGVPYSVSGSDIRVSARVGIAMYPDDASDGETLFRHAEAALKKAKAASEPYLFYEQGMSDRVSERLALETKLHRALENNEFVLHYQPKVNVESRAVTGVEALIRWNDPQSGLVPPMSFVPLLETSGLIVPVGAWALRQAAAEHRRMAEAGVPAPRIAVNISAVQLRHREFIGYVEDAVRAGATSSSLELEVTESVLMEEIDTNLANLKRVRELGFELAMDDFGTGYSSLAYLAKLPVQTLKIDRSFISKMQEDADAMTLVSTMVSLAHSLKLKVVAEGVETDAQARILRRLRCDEMQGYLISKPLPINELMEFLQRST
ncbi:MAG TPA: EAL domain-containing protein [Burkholderiales bacterium]|nr:EAL domain-containing protein [Burkholderiales bacterium]